MLDLNRDPSGDLARLRCDRCRRASTMFLGGRRIDAAAAPVVRDWLRMHCGGGGGWSLLPTIEGGQELVIDLCPRCSRKLEMESRP